jgi:hypothetical protein
MLKALEVGSDVASTMLATLDRLGDEAKRRIDPGLCVRAYLDALRRDGLLGDAVDVVSFVLPKQYAIAWGCECWRTAHEGREPDPVDKSAAAAAQRWLQDPSEENRRAALLLADRLGYRTAGAWLAAAAGWTGGTMMPAGEYEVPPPPGLPGTAVAAGVKLLAALEPRQFDERLARFVDTAMVTFAPDAPAVRRDT